MQMKLALTILPLFITSFAQAAYLCSASSELYPPLTDGVIFSREIPQLGAQGTSEGHKLLHENEHFSFWLTGGTLLESEKVKGKLIDFYVEIRNKKTGHIARAKSGEVAGQQAAKIELIRYPENSFLYQGLLMFSCKQYVFE